MSGGHGIEGNTLLIAAAPLRHPLSHEINHDGAHDAPGVCQELRTAGYFQPARPGKPQECFVDQGCSVEQGHAPAFQEPGMRELSKLPVQQREKLLVIVGGPFHSSLNPFIDRFRSSYPAA